MTASDWIASASIGVTLLIAVASGIWAVARARKASLFQSKKAKCYEEVFQHVCVGTIPRMSSYDWKSSAACLGVTESELRTEYREFIIKSESLDPRYSGLRLELFSNQEQRELFWDEEPHETGSSKCQEEDDFKTTGVSPEMKRKLRANAKWIGKRVLEGEAMLNTHRLYIDKSDRDKFRDYMMSAQRYARTPSREILRQLFEEREELERLVRSKLK